MCKKQTADRTHSHNNIKPAASSLTLNKASAGAWGGHRPQFNPSTPKRRAQQDGPDLGSKALSTLYLPREPKHTFVVDCMHVNTCTTCLYFFYVSYSGRGMVNFHGRLHTEPNVNSRMRGRLGERNTHAVTPPRPSARHENRHLCLFRIPWCSRSLPRSAADTYTRAVVLVKKQKCCGFLVLPFVPQTTRKSSDESSMLEILRFPSPRNRTHNCDISFVSRRKEPTQR